MYPRTCAVCGGSVESRALGVACANCWQQTTIFSTETLCWKCGQPSIGTVADDKREAVRCHRCDDASFTAARACGVYEGALRASVLALKREPHVCQKLRDELLKKQQRSPLNRATQIIPVPLHAEREKDRGFNQALLIGRELSRATSLPLNVTSLVRVKNSQRHRAGMDAKGRKDTVADAFSVIHPALITGERCCLLTTSLPPAPLSLPAQPPCWKPALRKFLSLRSRCRCGTSKPEIARYLTSALPPSVRKGSAFAVSLIILETL